MQLVLDDKIGRIELVSVAKWPTLPGLGSAEKPPRWIVAIDVAEEGAALTDPRQSCKLVDRRDQESGSRR